MTITIGEFSKKKKIILYALVKFEKDTLENAIRQKKTARCTKRGLDHKSIEKAVIHEKSISSFLTKNMRAGHQLASV